MNSSYLLKMNATPTLLKELDNSVLANTFIPDMFKKAFGDSSQENKITIASFYDKLISDPLYKNLFIDTSKARESYALIVKQFLSTGAFSYPKDYIDLIDSLKKRRSMLFNKYPLLRRANFIPEFLAKERLDTPTNSHVGTGVKHFIGTSKLEIFLEKYRQNSLSTDQAAFTYVGKERISLSSSPRDLYDNIKQIELALNNSIPSSRRKTESFHINPVFDNLKLMADPTRSRLDLKIVIDYPNGSPDDELSALLGYVKGTDSREASIALADSDPALVEKSVQSCARRGYLRDIFLKNTNRSVIDTENSKFKLVKPE